MYVFNRDLSSLYLSFHEVHVFIMFVKKVETLYRVLDSFHGFDCNKILTMRHKVSSSSPVSRLCCAPSWPEASFSYSGINKNWSFTYFCWINYEPHFLLRCFTSAGEAPFPFFKGGHMFLCGTQFFVCSDEAPRGVVCLFCWTWCHFKRRLQPPDVVSTTERSVNKLRWPLEVMKT